MPCLGAPIRQEDWSVTRYERDCHLERAENQRLDSWNYQRPPMVQVIFPTLGSRLMTLPDDLRTEATSTVAVVGGAQEAGMTFSTVGSTTTVPFGDRTIGVSATWRKGVLEQTLRGEDRDVDFRVVR